MASGPELQIVADCPPARAFFLSEDIPSVPLSTRSAMTWTSSISLPSNQRAPPQIQRKCFDHSVKILQSFWTIFSGDQKGAGSTFEASRRSIKMAAYEWTTLLSDLSRTTSCGKMASREALGS